MADSPLPRTTSSVRGRPRHPLRPPLVHRHPRPAQELLDQRGGAGRRLRGRHGLRRLVDHRLQRDRGVGHDRDAGPLDVQGAALASRGPRRGAHVLRRRDAEPRALRGRPAPGAAPRARPGKSLGFSNFYVGPELEFFYFRNAKAESGPRRRSSTRAATSTSPRSTPARTCAARPCSRSRSWESTWSTPTTRWARRSTRSTCATPTR